MMTADEMIAVIQAWKEGKKIECSLKIQKTPIWFPIVLDKPILNFEGYDYRVAKEKKKVTGKHWIVLFDSGEVLTYRQEPAFAHKENGVLAIKCLGEFTIEEGEGM
jgi:hypothetical protein